MQHSTKILLLALVAALALWALSRTKRGQVVAGDVLEEVIVTAKRIGTTVANIARWSLPAAGQRFAALFDDASRRYALPPLLLARVAYQESRFRDDIITGKTVSSAGALGIMQIVPRWHPGVDALDPSDAIPYAASYLSRLYARFGTWPLALAAYNWGQGNLSKDLQDGIVGDDWPQETRQYVAQITADVPV